MKDKQIVLFDMDGTLTPVRKQMKNDMVDKINELTNYYKVGIITGSDFEYVVDQIPQLFDKRIKQKDKIDIMPCNGTKRYLYSGETYELESHVDMIERIGPQIYQKTISECVKQQLIIFDKYTLPFTGTFLQYRKSLLNWCPIGRNAEDLERKKWVEADVEHGIRKNLKRHMDMYFESINAGLTIALGGSTSLDIYPDGWDKTFGLKHYGGFITYFVGDKCEEGGNDWHIYEKLRKYNRSYSTKGTSQTIDIINDLILKASKNIDS